MGECSEGTATIPIQRISSALYTSLKERASSTPSMEWKISPRFSALVTKQGRTPNNATLDISSIGEIKIRFSAEDYALDTVYIHKPIGYAPQQLEREFGTIRMEVSLLLSTGEGANKKCIRWILPVVQGTANENIALQSWLYSVKSATVQTFEDILPTQFQYIQWKKCVQYTSERSSNIPVTLCYCTQPLILDFNKTSINTSNLLQTAQTARNVATEVYIFSANPESTEAAAGAVGYSIYSMVSNATLAKQKRAGQRTAKCHYVQGINKDGTVNVDETGAPISPQMLAGGGGTVAGALKLSVDEEALKQQRETANTVIFWITISILLIIAGAFIVFFVFFWAPSNVKAPAIPLQFTASGVAINPVQPFISAVDALEAATKAGAASAGIQPAIDNVRRVFNPLVVRGARGP